MDENIRLDQILESEEYRKFFKEYCIGINSEENIIFWEMVQIYKMCLKDELKEVFDEIYQEFIKTDSKYELNIEFKARKEFEELKQTPLYWRDKKIFDELLKIVKSNMYDTYIHFVDSKEYRKMMGIPDPEEEKTNNRKSRKSLFLNKKHVEEIFKYEENQIKEEKSDKKSRRKSLLEILNLGSKEEYGDEVFNFMKNENNLIEVKEENFKESKEEVKEVKEDYKNESKEKVKKKKKRRSLSISSSSIDLDDY
jgi:hypothetical protein